MKQARRAGLSRSFVNRRLKSGRWTRKYRGIYVTVTGKVSREAELRAALTRAGRGAVFSYWTAAELQGLIDKPYPVIHITVPDERNPARHGRIPGVKIHRSDVIVDGKHVDHKTLRRTRVEDTVIDLINQSVAFGAAYNWICVAIGRGLTTQERLAEAMAQRGRVRYRRDLRRVFEAASGALSWLELRYFNGVEKPHGITPAERQVHVRQDGLSTYMDLLYRLYRTCLELDGAIAHPPESKWEDEDRDLWNLANDEVVTARFGVRHLLTDEDMCATAVSVTKILNARGPAVGHSCTRPGCTVPNYA
jgi:hypothetical protein